ncbi:putative DsbA family dithiol-disulfide isomerase [Pseudorhizobium tarimense]|uniref:DsbA family dithiol-disulfide isomerase n=1 Tax=Pseudorhizobium tarimense TaxID=1079109 RepID=A0ABV2H2I2_9HYPH|nr:DsbA family oxidoreductase [Pseudorhizobium tarimense]MCJ8518259.1 DsbA family oxidoreductase [Pseudorhizobium tarimense]
MERVTIDVVSDVVCPWCYLGKARLELAIAEVQDELGVDVNWRPYQLDPDATSEGSDYRTHLVAKFGSAERLDQMQDNLRGQGQEIGITYRFEDIKVRANTLDAHRLLHWSRIEGQDIQDRVATALFKAHFEKGLNVADHQVLLAIAEQCGLDPALIGNLLATDADKDTVLSEIDAAQKMGVNGVPFLIFDGQYAVSGAQTPDVLANALRDIARMKAEARKGMI